MKDQTQIMVRLNPELKEAIKRLAKEDHRTVNSFMIKMIRERIEASKAN